jgi:phosphatidylglycerol---prolipoprotein diacylglyceryl transferase
MAHSSCYGKPMSPSHLHSLFEVLAWVAALAVGLGTRRRFHAAVRLPLAGRRYPIYLLLVWFGAVAGAYGLGNLNLALARIPGEGRSILGALLGGIVVAEVYKAIHGIRGSTGAIFVLPLAVAITIGRLGCFLAGLPDYTYGVPTGLPWGIDFGDLIPRHPVQLYESLAMLGFALFYYLWLRRRPADAARHGFYFFAAVYGLQRFLWEFLKPYPTVLGPLNVFHLAAAVLVLYAAAMSVRAAPADAIA